MKKLQKARMTLSVTIAGFTGSSIVLIKNQIIPASHRTGVINGQATDNNLVSNILLIFILLIALYVTHILFKWIATRAFRFELLRKLILRQDYVEGYWQVENSIGDYQISTGFMQYQIIDEKLKITGEHFSCIKGQKESINIFKSKSVSADCYKGDYYNHFDMPDIGPGIAVGYFSSDGPGGGIPNSFDVQVVVTTTPDRIFNWGRNTPLWINNEKLTDHVKGGFSSLLPGQREKIIDLMAKNNVVTMSQRGFRIPKEVVDKAKKDDFKNYKRILAEKQF